MKKTILVTFLTFAILLGLSPKCHAQETTDSVKIEKKKKNAFKQLFADTEEQNDTTALVEANQVKTEGNTETVTDDAEKEAAAQNAKKIAEKNDEERSVAALEKQIAERDAAYAKLKAENDANKADADELAKKLLSVKTEVMKAEQKKSLQTKAPAKDPVVKSTPIMAQVIAPAKTPAPKKKRK